MPQFYFHLASPDGVSPDEVGSSFPDIEAAYLGACEAALEMSVDMLRRRHDPSRHRFEITNGDGEALFDIPFAEVLRPAARPGPPTKRSATCTVSMSARSSAGPSYAISSSRPTRSSARRGRC